MNCPRHPERWAKKEFDLDELRMIAECPDCLEAFENQVLSEVENGQVPGVSPGFANAVLGRIAGASHETGRKQRSSKRLTLVHYVTAAAAAIILTLSGGFNTAFHSASDYNAAFNRYVNEVTTVTTKVSMQNARYSLDELIKSRFQKQGK